MAPHSYISLRCCLTSSYMAGGTLVVLHLKGVSSVCGIWCCLSPVSPRSGPFLAKIVSHLWRTSFALVLLSLSSFTSPKSKVGSILSLSSKPSGPPSRTDTDSRAQSVVPFDRVMAFLPPFLTSTRKFLCWLPLASGSTSDGSTSNRDFLSLEVRPYFQSASVLAETTTVSPGASCILELVTKWAKALGLCDAAWKLL